jgi:hypothetical protein
MKIKLVEENKMVEKSWIKMDRKTSIIVLLALLLIIAIGYIGVSEYNRLKSERELGIYQQGVKSGGDQTLLYLFQQGSTCKPIPLFVNNQTITMIPIECVYNQAATCNPLAVTVKNQTLNLVATECIQQNTRAKQ